MLSYLNPIPRLPKPQGPHRVGTLEWEVPISEIPSSSAVPDSTISTVKFRLFYPTAPLKSPSSIKWLPSPQKQWNEAYGTFIGLSDRMASWSSSLPSLLNYISICATSDADLPRPKDEMSRYPLVIFSHGLGGNFNAYSSICASLASYGVVCAAPEHRDGSAPISFIRSSNNEQEVAIPYQKHPHSPTKEVLDARNTQLRVRLWELELIYTVLSSLNSGKTLTNYASSKGPQDSEFLKDRLDLRPGRVTWAGHSFGSASTMQFVKSVYYHQYLPSLKGTEYESDPRWQPLYTPAANGELVKQITPDSPVVLLDLWTMPLRGESTQWLWERPLPCYEKTHVLSDGDTPNVISILSGEFNKYVDLVNRTKASLSPNPAEAIAELERRTTSSNSLDSSKTATSLSSPGVTISLDNPPTSSSPSTLSSSSPSPLTSRTPSPSPASSTTSITPSEADITAQKPTSSSTSTPHLYHIPNSAHLSQSDFGLLFPNLMRYMLNAQDPVKTTELNIRAILAMMRGQGLNVAAFAGKEDAILKTEGVEERFLRVPLV